MSALYSLEWLLSPGALELNAFNHPWKFQVTYVFPQTCHKSVQTSDSSGIMLAGDFLASHSSQHAGRHSSLVSPFKGFHHRCFSRLGVQGSAIAAINL